MQISVLPLGALQTNCYVVTDEQTKTCAVIDPADDGERIADALSRLGLTLKLILLTHGHYDHVSGVRALHDATGAPVYLNARDTALPESMTAGPLFFTNPYDEGDELALGGISFRVLATPGHTPGSVCLLADDVLFAGDTLFQGSCGRTDLPCGSMTALYASLRKLSALPGDYRVYPGHGGDTTLAAERAGNFYLKEAAAQ